MRQSFRLKAGLRARKSRLVSFRKIFLPTKFSYPTFRGSAPMASTRQCPPLGTAQRNHFPINKTADRGQEDFMGRKISQAAGSRAQKPSILPPKGGTTNSEKRARHSPKNFPTNKIFLPPIPETEGASSPSSCGHFLRKVQHLPAARKEPKSERNKFDERSSNYRTNVGKD